MKCIGQIQYTHEILFCWFTNLYRHISSMIETRISSYFNFLFHSSLIFVLYFLYFVSKPQNNDNVEKSPSWFDLYFFLSFRSFLEFVKTSLNQTAYIKLIKWHLFSYTLFIFVLRQIVSVNKIYEGLITSRRTLCLKILDLNRLWIGFAIDIRRFCICLLS